MDLFNCNRIVLVADNAPNEGLPNELYNRESDKAQSNNVSAIKKALESICKDVVFYDSIEKFTYHTSKHINDLVFPYWHGEKSRNKQALVAAVCEAAGIKYIGADAYSNIVCCDKVLAKDLCKMNGVVVPESICYKRKISTSDLPKLKYPIVVKPNYEGSSIGISQNNLILSPNNQRVVDVVNELYENLGEQVIVEQFIPGKEISVSMIGWKNHIKVWGAVERYSKIDELYFENHLHSHQDKINNVICLKNAKQYMTKSIMTNLFELFDSLDKIEYIRIDGKYYNNNFYCFELSQDTTLAPDGAFFKAISYGGYGFKDTVNLLINNCLERYNNLYPNQ